MSQRLYIYNAVFFCTLVFVELTHLFSVIKCHLIHLYLEEETQKEQIKSRISLHVLHEIRDRCIIPFPMLAMIKYRQCKNLSKYRTY